MIRWLLILAVVLPANAVTIFNVTTSTMIFSDDFENGSFTPSVGSWSIVGPDVTVTNALVPGPAQGSFYARLFRDTVDTIGQGSLQAQLSSVQSNTGDVIRLTSFCRKTHESAQFARDCGLATIRLYR